MINILFFLDILLGTFLIFLGFYINLDVYIYLITFYWVYSLIFFPDKDNYLTFLYLFLFGLFFVLPAVFLGGGDFVGRGLLLHNISLESNEKIIFLIVISTFLVFFRLSTLSLPKARQQVLQLNQLKNKSLLYFLFFISFCWISLYNIREAMAVIEEGYLKLAAGELSMSKGLITLAVEQVFIALSILLISSKNKAGLIFFLIYCLTLMLVGQRMPPLFLAFFALLYFQFLNGKRLNVVLLGVMAYVFLVPLIQLIAVLRTGNIGNFEFSDMGRFYIDIWNVVGHSSDTLKASIVHDGTYNIIVSPFAQIFDILEVIMERLFGYESYELGNGFAVEFTKAYQPNLYELGVTFASSSIAEAYYFGGIVLVAILGLLTPFISTYLERSMKTQNLFYLAIFFIFAPRFFTSIRNEMIGWAISGIIYLLILIPFLYFVYRLFLSRRA